MNHYHATTSLLGVTGLGLASISLQSAHDAISWVALLLSVFVSLISAVRMFTGKKE